MKGRNLILLLLCLLLLVLPMLCVGHLVEHGDANCADDQGEPLNHAADACRILVRLEELGACPPPLLPQPALDPISLAVVMQFRELRVDGMRNSPDRGLLAYPPSDRPLRI